MGNENLHIDFDLLTKVLTGEATPEEQQVVDLWKEASSANLLQYNELAELWKVTGNTSAHQNIDVDKEWEIQKKLNSTVDKKINIKTRNEKRVISFSSTLKYAASIIVLVGITYFAYHYFSVKTIETGLSETKEITLPDGTIVSLNANSKLTYGRDFGKKLRMVNFKGEGFFSVTKNAKIPFVVKTDETEVKVLGTAFNIREFGDTEKMEVTVSEGKVSVYKTGNEKEKVIITKGEKAICNSFSKSVIKQPNNDKNFIAWKTRVIIFENDSLSSIVQTLSNVYHTELVIIEKETSHCTVTTKFENKDLNTVLKILQSTLDIEITQKDGKIYIKGKGC